MKYFSSDRHLGHENVLEFDPRPFTDINEHDDFIINELCKLTSKDEVYFLGDLVWRTSKEILHTYKNRLLKVKARMYRIIGNHDYKQIRKILGECFETIDYYGSVKYNKRKIIMSHYPFATRAGMYRHPAVIHLHGHTHQKPLKQKEDNRICVSYNGGKLLWTIDEII